MGGIKIGGSNNQEKKSSIKIGASQATPNKELQLKQAQDKIGVEKSGSLLEKKVENQRALEREMAEVVANDMETINMDFNEFEHQEQQKRYRSIMIKKWLVIISIVVFSISMVGLATYKAFNYEQLKPEEIAVYANMYNGNTNFPDYGVDTYLSKNVSSLMSEQVNVEDNDVPFTFENVKVDNIYKKSDKLADVYYYVTIKSGDQSTELYCMMPVKWNDEKGVYGSGGIPVITNLVSSSSNSKIGSSERLKFNEDAIVDSSTTKEQKTFTDNFFKMFYSGQDVSPFYKGPQIKKDPNQEYGGLISFEMYSEPNPAGYNAIAEIMIKLPGGLEYKTNKYLLVVQNGETYTIDGLN